jgi:predicted GIY-YIG superfamily endonuclease
MKTYKIYKIINKTNNKIYVGYTLGQINNRFNRHKILAKKK